METNIINALKRLERAGEENSRVTQKLREAVNTLEVYLTRLLPSQTDLPWKYYITATGDANYLMKRTEDYESLEWIYDEFYECPAVKIYDGQRSTLLEFSHDVANGLLDKFSDFLEARNKQTEKSLEIIETAELKA